MKRGPKPTPAIERWRKSVTKTDTCWLWTGAKQANGYGRFRADSGRIELVHRWTYEHFVGPIPDGLTIDHLCRNTSCVNPAHMEPVTREVNAWRGSRNKDKARCDSGHELTPENVYVSPSRPTMRDCRTCRTERAQRRYQRDKAARHAETSAA